MIEEESGRNVMVLSITETQPRCKLPLKSISQVTTTLFTPTVGKRTSLSTGRSSKQPELNTYTRVKERSSIQIELRVYGDSLKLL